MYRCLIRIVSFLLIPCLIGNALIKANDAPFEKKEAALIVDSTAFTVQALAAPAGQFSGEARVRNDELTAFAGGYESAAKGSDFTGTLEHVETDLTGFIVGKKVTPDQELAWREQILRESDDVKETNPDVIALVQQRTTQLLNREAEIRDILRRDRVSSEQIESVIKALRNPSTTFQWFDAIVRGREKYILGTESALASNLIRYLNDQESERGVYNLIDEYILHEAIERTVLDHAKIIALTRRHFDRGDENPLGDALRAFIRFDARSYAPKLSDREIHAIRDRVEDFHQRMEAAQGWAQKAQVYFRELKHIDLSDAEMTPERMIEFLTGPLKIDFGEFIEVNYGSTDVLHAMEALIELDMEKALSFFIGLLVHPDAGFRLTAATALASRLHWKPKDLSSKALLLMAQQRWERLAKFGRKHLTEALAANRVALMGTGLIRGSDESPFAHEAAIDNLAKLGQLAESVLLEGLRRGDEEIEEVSYDEWDYRIAILKALERMPYPSVEAMMAAEQIVANALSKGNDYLAQEAGVILQKLRMAA